MDSYEKAKVKKHIGNLIRRGNLRDRNIILFGASGFSKDVLSCLEERGYSANAVADNDARKIGTRFLGMPVRAPGEVLEPFEDKNIILFYSHGFYREITAQLTRMGYKKNEHVFAFNFHVSDTLYMFAYMTKVKLRGMYWYKKLTRGHSSGCRVFIAPYTGVGDIYLIGLFFRSYLKKHSISDYVFAVVTGACKKVAEMFDIKNIFVLPQKAGDDMISLQRATNENLNIMVLNDGWMGDPLQWFRGYKGLNFEKMFRCFVFGFDDEVPFMLPQKKDCGKEVEELFEKYSLIKGKTVVLSPYSNTLFDLPNDVLSEIVSYCKSRGLIPVTNCVGKEQPIEGTQAVFFPLTQAIAFMDAAGYFVGVRSGLCDVISSSKCKKVIIYEKDGIFYKSSHFEYFSLQKMGLCDDAVELQYHDDLKNECLHEIFEVLK